MGRRDTQTVGTGTPGHGGVHGHWLLGWFDARTLNRLNPSTPSTHQLNLEVVSCLLYAAESCCSISTVVTSFNMERHLLLVGAVFRRYLYRCHHAARYKPTLEDWRVFGGRFFDLNVETSVQQCWSPTGAIHGGSRGDPTSHPRPLDGTKHHPVL